MKITQKEAIDAAAENICIAVSLSRSKNPKETAFNSSEGALLASSIPPREALQEAQDFVKNLVNKYGVAA